MSRRYIPEQPLAKDGKKLCGACADRKTIHFFSPAAWAMRLDSDRQCLACIRARNKDLHPSRGVPGRVRWRATNPVFFLPSE